MNKQEYLLACLSEECAEVQQLVGKMLRFGVTDAHPDGKHPTNDILLGKELNDILAILDMLEDAGIYIPDLYNPEEIAKKRAKVEFFMTYSRERGVLKDVPLNPDKDRFYADPYNWRYTVRKDAFVGQLVDTRS